MKKNFQVHWIKPLLLVILHLLMMGIMAFIIVIFSSKIASQIIYNDAFDAMGTQISLLLVIIISRKFLPLDKKILDLKIEIEKVPYLICLGCILFIVTVILMNFLGFSPYRDSSYSLYLRILSLLTACILAPVIEEFLFRGIMFNNLVKKYSLIFSAIYSSALFAIIHVSFIRLLPTFIVGATLCWVLNKEQKIIYPILVHMTINILSEIYLFMI